VSAWYVFDGDDVFFSYKSIGVTNLERMNKSLKLKKTKIADLVLSFS